MDGYRDLAEKSGLGATRTDVESSEAMPGVATPPVTAEPFRGSRNRGGVQ